MTTQRPFFYNLLSSFRAHPALKPPTSTSTSTSTTITAAAAAAYTTSTSTSTSPSTSTSTSVSASTTHHKPSTLVSAFSPTTASATSPTQHHTRKAAAAASAASAAVSATRRRGSDSSSDGGCGFRDTLGGERWFIGGRTGLGEERFYRLTMARRERSIDRVSLDRMSL